MGKKERKKEVKKGPKRVFGKLLFISIISMFILVYLILIFNQYFVWLIYLKSYLLYVVCGILIVSLIFLLHPKFLFAKLSRYLAKRKELYRERVNIKKKEKINRLLEKKRRKAEKKELYGERVNIKKKEKINRLLEKKRRKAEKLRLKEKKKEQKLLDKRKKRIAKLGFKDEKDPIKKGKGIFSRLFKKKDKKKEGGKKGEKEKKVKVKKEKVPLVTELSKSLKIEMGRYETNIDMLYKIIEKTGRVKLSAISEYFGIERKRAENWANILQEHDLADIHYPAFGGPELIRKAKEEGEEEEEKKDIPQKETNEVKDDKKEMPKEEGNKEIKQPKDKVIEKTELPKENKKLEKPVKAKSHTKLPKKKK